MSYKILHFSDLNLDSSFAGQGFPLEYGIERRLGLRAMLTSILARAREFKVDALTIGGNLFVQEYLLPETADFIHQQLALLSPIRVIIAPGSQDPYTNESPYAYLNWPENVDIFYQGKLTHLELTQDIHLWGACNPLMRGGDLFDSFQPAKGINILLLHALQGPNKTEAHTISHETVQKAGFSLALLGGKRVSDIYPAEKQLLVYPGSPEPLAPLDESGHHQVVLVEADEQNISIQSLSLQQWHYRTIDVDITKCSSSAEAAQLIDTTLEVEIAKMPRSAISVVLCGQPHFNLNVSDLRHSIQTSAFFGLEDHFGLTYDLEQLGREQTVRGLLVRRFQERIRDAADEFEKGQQLTSLHFALQALEGKQVNLHEAKPN